MTMSENRLKMGRIQTSMSLRFKEIGRFPFMNAFKEAEMAMSGTRVPDGSGEVGQCYHGLDS